MEEKNERDRQTEVEKEREKTHESRKKRSKILTTTGV